MALYELPQILADVVREAFGDEPDVIVENVPGTGTRALSRAIQKLAPDVVIQGGPPACKLLLEHPRIVILGVTPDGRQAWICALHPHPHELVDVSLAGLRVAVIDALEKHRRALHGLR